jgi:hypothetical protein
MLTHEQILLDYCVYLTCPIRIDQPNSRFQHEYSTKKITTWTCDKVISNCSLQTRLWRFLLELESLKATSMISIKSWALNATPVYISLYSFEKAEYIQRGRKYTYT